MGNASITFIPPSNTSLPGGIPTANTIEYFEKGIDEQGPYYLVQYYINNWQDSDTFINALLGYSTAGSSIYGSGAAGVIKRSPHQYPLSTNLLCRRARAIAPGCAKLGSSGLPDFYGGALIQAEYRAPQWQAYPNVQEQIDPLTPIPFCTQELEHTTETYTLPKKQMVFASSQTNQDIISGATFSPSTTSTEQDFRIRVPVTNLTLTFHLSPNLYVATGTIRSIRGCVNSTTFLGAQPQCVLFRGCRTVRNYDSAGNVVQEIQLIFSERDPSQIWNSLPDISSMTWKPVGMAGSTVLPYPKADFNQFVFGF